MAEIVETTQFYIERRNDSWFNKTLSVSLSISSSDGLSTTSIKAEVWVSDGDSYDSGLVADLQDELASLFHLDEFDGTSYVRVATLQLSPRKMPRDSMDVSRVGMYGFVELDADGSMSRRFSVSLEPVANQQSVGPATGDGAPYWDLRKGAAIQVTIILAEPIEGTSDYLDDVEGGIGDDEATPSANLVQPCDPPLEWSVYFDGTGNNKFEQMGDSESNVARIYELQLPFDGSTYTPVARDGLIEEIASRTAVKLYMRGVGSDDAEYKGIAGMTGLGIEERIEIALKRLKAFIGRHRRPPRITIDTYGFSRGAATARAFIARLAREVEPAETTSDVRTLEGCPVVIRFVGLFDTVSSIGLAGNDQHLGHDMDIDPDFVGKVCHVVALDERRTFFPLHSLWEGFSIQVLEVEAEVGYRDGIGPFPLGRTVARSIFQRIRRAKEKGTFGDMHELPPVRGEPRASLPANFVEFECVGVHSDVGGGYPNRMAHGCDNNYLALYPLMIMHDQAQRAGVRLASHDRFTDIPEFRDQVLEQCRRFYIDNQYVRRPEAFTDYMHDSGLSELTSGNPFPVLPVRNVWYQRNHRHLGFRAARIRPYRTLRHPAGVIDVEVELVGPTEGREVYYLIHDNPDDAGTRRPCRTSLLKRFHTVETSRWGFTLASVRLPFRRGFINFYVEEDGEYYPFFLGTAERLNIETDRGRAYARPVPFATGLQPSYAIV